MLQVLQFRRPPFEAGPRHHQRAFAFGLFLRLFLLATGDEVLNLRTRLHNFAQHGSFIHSFKTRGELDGASDVLHHFDIRRSGERLDEVGVGQNIIAQFARALFVAGLAFDGREHRAEGFGRQQIRIRLGAFLGQPQQQIGCGRVMVDEMGQLFLKFLRMVVRGEKTRALTHQPRGHMISHHQQRGRPFLIMCLEGIKHASLPRCRHGGHHCFQRRIRLPHRGLGGCALVNFRVQRFC